jgi:hypothetical protein
VTAEPFRFAGRVQFSPEGELLVSLPSVCIGDAAQDVVVPPIYLAAPSESVDRVRRVYPCGVRTMLPDFTEVHGLRGRVSCEASGFLLGDDGDPTPAVRSATLSDVKICPGGRKYSRQGRARERSATFVLVAEITDTSRGCPWR